MPDRVQRFTASERGVHWITALAFFSLLLSGLVVGRRGAFHNVMYAWHLASAAALVGGVALITLAGNRRALAATTRQLRTLDAEDRQWLSTAPSRLLAALYITGGDTILAGTHHNLIFGGHKLATIGICVLVAGHLYMALVNPTTRHALRGMLTGEVDRDWARNHYPGWKP